MTEEIAAATDTAPANTPVTSTRQRKKRKWDQPAEGVVSAAAVMPGLLPLASSGAFAGLGAMPGAFPYVNYFSAVSSTTQSAVANVTSATVQQNAVAIVQKFNQDMASKGLLLQAKIQDELIAREITINDADPGVRYKLTKRQTQEEIQQKTGAVVITRGRYRPPNGPVEQEKPLYLHISAGVNLKDTAERIKAVDQAAAIVEEMLKQGQQAQAPLRSSLGGNLPNGNVPMPVTVNIFVGIEADPSFNLIGRIRGPNDQYINHIMTETGASVVLRGRGSGSKEGPSAEELPQPLHLTISSDNPKSVEDAKTLAENLLETIRGDSFPYRVPPHQGLPTAVPAISPSTYLGPQQAPYQPSMTQNAYGGYYPPVGGVYTPPYSMNQAPPPYPPSSTVAPSFAQPAPTSANPYTNTLPPTKVYGAVPPPSQLLGDQSAGESGQVIDNSVEQKPHVRIREKFAQSSTTVSPSVPFTAATISAVNPIVSGQAASSVSHSGYPPVPYVSSSQVLPQHRNGASPAQLSANQVSQSIQRGLPGQSLAPAYPQAFALNQMQAPTISAYSGYSGVYPEAPPLQQVAQALQRPPLPVSVKPPTSSALLATLTKAQSSSFEEKYSEKQPAQRRKFLEFPVGAKDASGEEQVYHFDPLSRLTRSELFTVGRAFPLFHRDKQRRATIRSGLDATTLSEDLSPPGTNMPPPAPRSMPPPPSKSMPPPKYIASAVSSRPTSAAMLLNSSLTQSFSAGSKRQDENVAPPGTGLKLVEYGEEEEESSAGHTASPQSKAFSSGKPFWAP